MVDVHPVADFLRLLPDVESPVVLLEDDGDIGFDWGVGDRTVSAHISTSGRGGWAALVGSYKSHGKFIVRDGLPAEFLYALRMWAGQES